MPSVVVKQTEGEGDKEEEEVFSRRSGKTIGCGIMWLARRWLAGWLAVAASGLRHCSGFCQERQNSDNSGIWRKNRKLVGVRSS
jgi:hypothetical protein